MTIDQKLTTPSASERGHRMLEVSNAVVRIHKQYYGKGPNKARSHMSQNVLTVILDGGYTRAEETLVAADHADEVVQSRLALQEAVSQELQAAVERILGGKVRSFMSANDPVQGLQAEIFVFEAPAEPSSEEDLTERARRAREQNEQVLEEHRALRAEQRQSRSALSEQRQHAE